MTVAADAASPARFKAAREALVADHRVGGAAFMTACTDLTDRWLAAVFAAAVEAVGEPTGHLALVALGGYGRGELCPGSDLDLLLVHRKAGAAAKVAEAIWYPVWDSGVKLGHAVRTLAEAADIAGTDVESATAMLDARLLRGDAGVFEELVASVSSAWAGSSGRARAWLRTDADDRLDRFGDAAFSVEPNLKVGRGGLRDAQVPSWLGGDELLVEDDAISLEAAVTTLLEARIALHRCSPGSGDVLRLEDQDAVGRLLGDRDADVLMRRIARAARAISWVTDDMWARLGSARSGRGRRRGESASADAAPVVPHVDAIDPISVLRVAALAASRGVRLDRAELARVGAEMPSIGDPWPAGALDAFVGLLATGAGAIPVIESLDHVGAWGRILPEWDVVRSRPQRTTHHRYTVDRHLLEAVAVAATLSSQVARPDLLVLGALFHDLGKGHGGNHSEVGVDLVDVLAVRMGIEPADADVLKVLVRHHLLLPEVATRRDLGDPATLDAVASAVGSVEVLGLLMALTEADARATGPTAWTDWKVGLVSTLVERTAWRIEGDRRDQYGPVFPSVEQMLLLRAGVMSVVGEGHTLTVVAPDQPGLFSRVAGVLVLRGLDVQSAEATSSDGTALEEFTVSSAFASADLADAVPVDWPAVTADIERAMAGRLAIEARVSERANTYRRRVRSADTEVRVRFDDTVEDVTMLEVDAPDGVGVLYRVTRALSDLRVDIRQARVETLTDRVVDAFSIVDADGLPIDDVDYRREIERAVEHAVGV